MHLLSLLVARGDTERVLQVCMYSMYSLQLESKHPAIGELE